MNATNETTIQETKTEVAAPVPQGTKAPMPGEVGKSVHDQLVADELTIQGLVTTNKALTDEVAKLRANQKPATEKKPVDDATLSKAIAALEGYNRAQLTTPSPKLNLSLASQLEFQPLLSAAQKEVWSKTRDAMRAAHTAAWKAKSAVVIGHLKRAVRMPAAVMAGSITVRKTDDSVNAVSLRASKLAKPLKAKGKGKNGAKPAQVAGNGKATKSQMQPGNANPPAKIS